jgi:type II secretory pathway component GspD/PulD (secretin)
MVRLTALFQRMNVAPRIVAGLCASILGCVALAQTQAGALEVINLKYRTAEELIPVLQPLLESGGALSGEQYTLFVRTSSANLRQLRAALEQLDRQPRQLKIAVRRASSSDALREGVSASGTISTDRGAVSTNETARRSSGVTVRGTHTTDSESGNRVASVNVLEGSAAFIATGSSVPVVTAVAAGAGRRRWGGVVTEYRDLTDGFLVTPRMTPDGVVLNIEQRAERLRNGAIDRQTLTTQISARLGEWIQLGGVDESSASSRSGVLTREHRTQSDSVGVWIKVELE